MLTPLYQYRAVVRDVTQQSVVADVDLGFGIFITAMAFSTTHPIAESLVGKQVLLEAHKTMQGYVAVLFWLDETGEIVEYGDVP